MLSQGGERVSFLSTATQVMAAFLQKQLRHDIAKRITLGQNIPDLGIHQLMP
jgi:hypothetical protein